MSNPVLGTLTVEVTEAVGIMASASALIGGFQAKLEAAVAEAIGNGATEEELQPLNDLVTALDSEGNALAAAVQANS